MHTSSDMKLANVFFCYCLFLAGTPIHVVFGRRLRYACSICMQMHFWEPFSACELLRAASRNLIDGRFDTLFRVGSKSLNTRSFILMLMGQQKNKCQRANKDAMAMSVVKVWHFCVYGAMVFYVILLQGTLSIVSVHVECSAGADFGVGDVCVRHFVSNLCLNIWDWSPHF